VVRKQTAVLNWYHCDVLRADGNFAAARRPDGPLAGGRTTQIQYWPSRRDDRCRSGEARSESRHALIAIELYAPLPGGIAAGGRFAPASMNVPGLMDVPMPTAAAKPQ
jgi:hypothetical protein